MAPQERQQPEREFAPGITKAEDFRKLVEAHRNFPTRNTFWGQVRNRIELIVVRAGLEINNCAGGVSCDPLREIEYKTEEAVLVDLLIPR